MDVQEYLEQLSVATRSGAGFLLAYGLTWSIAAVAGWRFGERAGAWIVLFQGTVGLPLGLLLTHVLAEGPRPQDEALGALSLYLAMGQLLVLPLAIVWVAQRRHRAATALFAVVLAVHFVPYAWLYSTPLYLGVAAVIATGTAALVAVESESSRTAPAVCALTAAALLVGGGAALTL